MKNSMFFALVAQVILLSYLPAGTASAELIVVQRQESKAPHGTSIATMTLKYKGLKMRMDLEPQGVPKQFMKGSSILSTTIQDAESGEIISLFHTTKHYTITTPSQQKEGAERLFNMMKQRGFSPDQERPALRASNESRKIGVYTARKYEADIFNGHATYWLTTELDGITQRMKRFSGLGGQDLAVQFPDLEGVGFPVRTILVQNMGGTEVTSTIDVVSVEEIEIPDSVFEIPAGYKLQK